MNKVIRVAARERLLSLEYIYALAAALRSLGLSRRNVLDWLAELIFKWLEEGGIVIDEFGYELEFTDETIDDAHGKDATVRVISSIKASTPQTRRRRGRIGTLSLMRVYWVAFAIAGRPLLPEARQIEVNRMREIVRSFSSIRRVRYVREIRNLRRSHQGKRQAYYSAEVRRLRLRFAAEMAAQ